MNEKAILRRIESIEIALNLMNERLDALEAMEIDDSFCPVHDDKMVDSTIFGMDNKWYCPQCDLYYTKRDDNNGKN